MAEHEKSVADLAAKMAKALDIINEKGVDFAEKTARMEKISEEHKIELDKVMTEFNETKAELDALKQAVAGADDSADRKKDPKTMGQAFVEKFAKSAPNANDRSLRIGLQMKAGEVTNSPGSKPLGGITDLGIKGRPDTKLELRDLLDAIEIQTDSVEFTYLETFTNNAGMVAELAKKPQSELEFALETIPTRVVAHFIKASRQVLSDNTMLRGFIDGRLRRGLEEKVEQQILLGDGTGNNLIGLTARSTPFDDTYVAQVQGANKLDILRLAMLQTILAGYHSNGAILNPIDATLISLTKDENGGYLVQNPVDPMGNMRLWGLPTIESNSMTVNNFMVGDFKQAQLFNRWAANVEVGYENDDFTRNLVTILAEERLALGVFDTRALVRGEFPQNDGGGNGGDNGEG